MKSISKHFSEYRHKKRIAKIYKKQSYQQNLQTIKQNKLIFTDYVDKTFSKYIEQIKNFGEQNKKEIEELITQVKTQHLENLRENRSFTKEITKGISVIFHNEITTFTKQFSKHIKGENTKLLEQILEQSSEQINHQISEFIEKIAEQNNTNNSVFIKQNTKLITEILSQTSQNHQSIDQKFEKFVTYQNLSEFRENLVTIKTNILILERLDDTQLKIFRNLYLRYHKGTSKLPSLDVTQGILIIKILFPVFFSEMSKKLFLLKNEFEDKYTEMTHTIQSSDYFFMNFKKSEKLDEIKKMLDLDINRVDEQLLKLINPN